MKAKSESNKRTLRFEKKVVGESDRKPWGRGDARKNQDDEEA